MDHFANESALDRNGQEQAVQKVGKAAPAEAPGMPSGHENGSDLVVGEFEREEGRSSGMDVSPVFLWKGLSLACLPQTGIFELPFDI